MNLTYLKQEHSQATQDIAPFTGEGAYHGSTRKRAPRAAGGPAPVVVREMRATTLDAYPQIGSICSGGRYENLAGHYTKSKLPGVGISIGLTRLFFQLKDAGFVATAESSVDVLVALLDEVGLEHALALSQRLRAAGLNVETQLEPRKLAKQLQYADKAGIRFVVMRGEDEAARKVVTVKDLRRGEQFEVTEAELSAALLVEREQLRSAAGNA